MEIRKGTSNLIKVIASFLVTLGHLNFIKNAGIYGVSLFLIISGYGLFISQSNNGLYNFWYKRASTVLLPYSILTSIFFSGLYYK